MITETPEGSMMHHPFRRRSGERDERIFNHPGLKEHRCKVTKHRGFLFVRFATAQQDWSEEDRLLFVFTGDEDHFFHLGVGGCM